MAYRVTFQKNLDGNFKSKGGGFNKKSGTTAAKEGRVEGEWQGKTKGKNTHTYKTGGK